MLHALKVHEGGAAGYLHDWMTQMEHLAQVASRYHSLCSNIEFLSVMTALAIDTEDVKLFHDGDLDQNTKMMTSSTMEMTSKDDAELIVDVDPKTMVCHQHSLALTASPCRKGVHNFVALLVAIAEW